MGQHHCIRHHYSLDAYQLASGFVSCVMLIPTIQITYLSAGWIPHLRMRLSALDGCLSIEKAWVLHLQQQDDDSIMEVIADSKGLTPKEKQLANEMRIWLRVICILDLADVEGVSIAWNRLTGKWRGISAGNWVWPNQPTPSHEHWSAFRRCLRYTFCTSVSPC